MELDSKKFPDYLEIVVNPYAGGSGRKGVMIHGPWTDSIYDFIKENDIKAVFINCSKGWRGDDYSFLSGLTTIEELCVTDANIKNLKAIEGMTELVDMSLGCLSKDKIDFTKLRNLKKAYLGWWKGADSILDCYQIEELIIMRCKSQLYKNLAKFRKLKLLKLIDGNIKELSWLSYLNNLEHLDLLGLRKVDDFSPISKCINLNWLVINENKLINDLGFLKPLTKLEVLDLCNCGEIDSLKQLVHVKTLKALLFASNTVIKDGDLSVLEQLPKLAMLTFAGRRHYTHKLVGKWDWKYIDQPRKLLEKK